MMNGVPRGPRLLGLAGLLPQLACLYALYLGPEGWRWFALATGFGYAAVILSFVGGMWWGLAAGFAKSTHAPVPGWIWVAAIAPSLLAFACYLPWAFGLDWPKPELGVLAVAIAASLLIDRRLARLDLAPAWWMGLRIPLSFGLGLATLALALG